MDTLNIGWTTTGHRLEGMDMNKMRNMGKKLTYKEAAECATKHTNHLVSVSNIAYLVTYAKIGKFIEVEGKRKKTKVDEDELKNYYSSKMEKLETVGGDAEINFNKLKESETTKHVHRLHPYKGKFIPQLVEHYARRHFKKGDVVLDPFLGSGTTMVQLAEMGIHCVGIDVSEFNIKIANVKLRRHDLAKLKSAVDNLTAKLEKDGTVHTLCEKLDVEIKKFNTEHFPSPEFKKRVGDKEIIEKEYGRKWEQRFCDSHKDILSELANYSNSGKSFLDKWYTTSARKEIDLLAHHINNEESDVKDTLMVILSRTARSCRATTHSDLTTLSGSIFNPYYCRKHKKICRPLYSIESWWKRYGNDTVNRLKQYADLRNDSGISVCLHGDSSKINIGRELDKSPELSNLVKQKGGIDGVFTSPPYVGVIDYHEQHAYAYEIFDIKRHDNEEIGALKKKQSKQAIEEYKKGMVSVLMNCGNVIKKDGDIFVVVNDDRNLYPDIFGLSGLTICDCNKRFVSNRAEGTKAYFEFIYRVRKNQ